MAMGGSGKVRAPPPLGLKKNFLHLTFKSTNFVHKNLERTPLKAGYFSKVAEIGYPCWKFASRDLY